MRYSAARSAIVIAREVEERALPRQFGEEGQSSLLEYVLDSVWTVADEIYIVFRKEPSMKLIEAIAPFGVRVMIQSRGSVVSDMVTGFKASRSDCCLVVTSNVPFLKPNVAYALYEAARGYDAAVPRWRDGRTEPLLAVYRRQPFLRVTSRIGDAEDPSKVLDNLYAVRFMEIEEELTPLDPELNSFFAVRTAEDYKKASALATIMRH